MQHCTTGSESKQRAAFFQRLPNTFSYCVFPLTKYYWRGLQNEIVEMRRQRTLALSATNFAREVCRIRIQDAVPNHLRIPREVTALRKFTLIIKMNSSYIAILRKRADPEYITSRSANAGTKLRETRLCQNMEEATMSSKSHQRTPPHGARPGSSSLC